MFYSFFYDLSGLNEKIFIAINKATNQGSFIPKTLLLISQFFSIEKFAIYYLIICALLYFQAKKTGEINKFFTEPYLRLVRAGTCYAIFGFVYAGLKFSVNLPRPFCSLPTSKFLTIANITSERCLSSFPSAHSGMTIIICYYLWPYLNKFARIFAVAISVAVATSRITLAMHYPSDIIYGILLSIIIIYSSNKLCDLLDNKIIQPFKELLKKLLFSSSLR